MNQFDSQLVTKIADLVMQAIAGQMAQQTADVKPPVGICTAGDGAAVRSLQGQRTPGAVTQSLQADARDVQPVNQGVLLHGIVTANMLTDAMAESPDGVAMLARNAKLTPMASDLVRSQPEKVQREGLLADQPLLKHLTGGLPWIWWTCGNCDAVNRIVDERRSMLLPSSVGRTGKLIGQAVTDIDATISSGRAAGGIMFVTQAARAMCLTNRCRSLRSVLGVDDHAVRQGIYEIGPNVLVLEFTQNEYDQMADRVDMVMKAMPQMPAQMRRHLMEVGS